MTFKEESLFCGGRFFLAKEKVDRGICQEQESLLYTLLLTNGNTKSKGKVLEGEE